MFEIKCIDLGLTLKLGNKGLIWNTMLLMKADEICGILLSIRSFCTNVLRYPSISQNMRPITGLANWNASTLHNEYPLQDEVQGGGPQLPPSVL
ncbi:hypothetical protein Z043_115446 [Scleropages formosus]|uniref:Uncharacterized protein n=1 Tax=Scleropages formosus TaxID=113540 RepID=A0A0P7UWE8_SCLFO|nr:hypothetical protein Z043_115446 [Scleropages formosus]